MEVGGGSDELKGLEGVDSGAGRMEVGGRLRGAQGRGVDGGFGDSAGSEGGLDKCMARLESGNTSSSGGMSSSPGHSSRLTETEHRTITRSLDHPTAFSLPRHNTFTSRHIHYAPATANTEALVVIKGPQGQGEGSAKAEAQGAEVNGIGIETKGRFATRWPVRTSCGSDSPRHRPANSNSMQSKRNSKRKTC